MTPSPGWDRGTGSETRPRKTGFLSHSLLTGQHTSPKSFPREKPRAFFGPGRSEKRKKETGERQGDRYIDRYSVEQHGKSRGVGEGLTDTHRD